MHLRRLVPAAAALSAVITLSACGASSPSASSPVSPSIKTAAFTPLTKANFGSTIGNQVKSIRSVRMELTSTVMNVGADFAYGPPLAMTMAGTISAQGRSITMDERLLGTMLYVKIPGMTPAGKYVGVDLAKLPATSRMFAILQQLQKLGPHAVVSQFRHGIDSVRYVGRTQINGQAARHYTIVVDSAAALKAVGAASSLVQSSIPKTITEQIYVDDHRIPLRIVTQLPAPVGAMQIDFSKWGEAVHVVAPPASQVMTVSPAQLGASA